jgi:hypothetical protein
MSARHPNLRHVVITQGAAGAINGLVAGKTSRRIVVYGMQFTLGAIGTAKFQSNATDITGAFDIDVRGGLVCPPVDRPIFECQPGEDLNMVTTGGAAKGVLQYAYEDR